MPCQWVVMVVIKLMHSITLLEMESVPKLLILMSQVMDQTQLAVNQVALKIPSASMDKLESQEITMPLHQHYYQDLFA